MHDTREAAKLDKLTQLLIAFANGDFNARVELDEDDNVFNASLSGLNMLGEELKNYKAALEYKSSLLENTLVNINEIVYAIQFVYPLDHLKFEFVSLQVRRLLGYSEEDLYRDPHLWYQSIHPEDQAIIDHAFAQLSQGMEVMCEYRIKPKGSEHYIWLEDHMNPKKQGDGAELKAFCSARDVSKRKDVMQEREKLIKELNDKYNELTQFNYIVSHNLRSPVAGIMGACHLLKMSLSESELKETHSFIEQSAEKLDTLLKDLNLILSTKSKINERYETFSITEMLDDIQHLLKPEIERSGAAIHIDVTPRAEQLNSIKSYIQSCLFNLVTNAIKYRHPSRPLKIYIKVWKEYQTTYFRVSDNGIGINLQQHGKEIFGLYKRFNDTAEGRGLGLHMTKVQITSLGGTITVESKLGVGSTFTLSYPDQPL